jgi:hypothetical protein
MTVCQTITEGVFATGREAARSCGRQRLRLIPTGAYCSAHFAGDENDGDGDNQKGIAVACMVDLLAPAGATRSLLLSGYRISESGAFRRSKYV